MKALPPAWRDRLLAEPGKRPGDREHLLHKLRREALYVPASMRAADLMLRMQSTRIHLALVIDEFGGTDGLVTLEDLIEAVVGDIADEHDEAEVAGVVDRVEFGQGRGDRPGDFDRAAGAMVGVAEHQRDRLGRLRRGRHRVLQQFRGLSAGTATAAGLADPRARVALALSPIPAPDAGSETPDPAEAASAAPATA